jgi:PncC family amidohydrolase
MQELIERAEILAALLRERQQTIAVAESSTGGLVAAALLSVAGASAYFLGGAVVYTRASRQALLGISDAALAEMRPSTEPYARLLADSARRLLSTSWAIGETGATGPTGNRYGDAAGHCCLAISGERPRALTVETGAADRLANMRAFAGRALELAIDCVRG